ncbi:unnamed protein product [Calypogeia fissa]
MAQFSLVLVAVLSCMLAVSVQGIFNITAILEPYPSYSAFNQWLTDSGVAEEANARTTITVFASTNDVVNTYLSSVNGTVDPVIIADTLRYQILLTYYGWTELAEISLNNHTSVTTLLQTTGRANDTGFVDIYHTTKGVVVGHYHTDSYGNKTVTGNVTKHPYSYSVLELSSLLLPLPTFLPAPAGAPIPGAPAPAPKVVPKTVPKATPTTTSHATSTRVAVPLMVTALFMASINAVLL